MGTQSEAISMAVFCDFENVALGVRDAKYEKFDIKPVLERLLLKGSIVVKKAYCDWERYKGFKATMHEANFELIEIPHVRQSGKNSADIRLVVDALDLCYTKSHVNTFVIVSGDSDFSPLVSKLRENAKQVIGVGVKQSTSDLLIANCDEFIFYDDLVRENQRKAARREQTPQQRLQPEQLEARRSRAIEMAVETLDALVSERSDSGKIWASVLKEAIKRRKPDFNESYFGFKAFGNLLEEAQARGLLQVGRDEKSNTYVQHLPASAGVGAIVTGTTLDESSSDSVAKPPVPRPQTPAAADGDKGEATTEESPTAPPKARSTRGRRKPAKSESREQTPAEAADAPELAASAVAPAPAPVASKDSGTAAAEAPEGEAKSEAKKPRRGRTTRKAPAATGKVAVPADTEAAAKPPAAAEPAEEKPKPRRTRRTTKAKTTFAND